MERTLRSPSRAPCDQVWFPIQCPWRLARRARCLGLCNKQVGFQIEIEKAVGRVHQIRKTVSFTRY